MQALEKVTPGTKVFKLFAHEKLICEGKEEVFIISIQRMSREEYERRLKQRPADQ
ncbi:hypothetical protein G3578_12800 [Brevibacillus sp. SYP-B805]|jgi:hypothetical protein|uniref:hypothetical protein n=1 Tax=Brevibacillus sp. SYP-B805 TaxID=1578199 RepID=UPI0013EC92DE|nr:hypothetical protein [Brevibacillus sp. SYP-B805]NGQ96037.1 hypothetical protein [Brevibacillus sp. SYP-B805]